MSEADLSLPELRGEATEVDVAPDAALQAFLQERQSGIGGTDAAALVGLHPYRSLSDVVLEKRGLIPQQEGNERMFWGTELEEPIARAYAARQGVKLRRVNQVWRDPMRSSFIAHPDRDVVGLPKGLELKTVDGFAVQRWSEPGKPLKVPEEYFCQVQWYLGFKPAYVEWDLAALFGVRAMRVYTLARNDKVIAALREKAQEVWERYVVGSELPPMDPSPRSLEYLRKSYPREAPGEYFAAPPEAVEWVQAWREHGAAEKAAEREKDRYRAHLAGLIGRAEGMAGPGWVVSFKANRDQIETVTDYEAVLHEVLAKHQLELDAEILVKHTKVNVKPGPRVMRFKEIE